MPSIQKVVLAGATGSLGRPVLEALIKAKYEVTVFTRSGSNKDFPSHVKVAAVDYTNLDNLTEALKGQDAVISTLATTAVEQQKCLTDAAIAAGIKRIIPSEFGCDLFNPKARALPVYQQKVQVEEYIQDKTRGTSTTYTFVFNNSFLDWGTAKGFLIDAKSKSLDMYDGGDGKFTATPLPFVAAGVVAVLQKPEETANRAVRLHGASLTQKELLKVVQGVVGADGWTINDIKSEDMEKQAYAKLQSDPSNVMAWVIPFLKRAIFADGYGGNLEGNNDNELLGLKEMSEADVEEVVRSTIGCSSVL